MVENSNSAAVLRSISGSGTGRKAGIPASLQEAAGPYIAVRIDAPESEFSAGTLVELSLPNQLCLGEILSRDGDLLIVRPEHTLLREALDDIRKNWKQVASPPC